AAGGVGCGSPGGTEKRQPFCAQPKTAKSLAAQAGEGRAGHAVPEPAGVRRIRFLPFLRRGPEMSPLRRGAFGTQQWENDLSLLRLRETFRESLPGVRIAVYRRFQGRDTADRSGAAKRVSRCGDPAHGL